MWLLETAEIIYHVRIQDYWLPLAGSAWKGGEGSFWGSGNDLFLNLAGVYTSLFTLWKLVKAYFSVYMLNLN